MSMNTMMAKDLPNLYATLADTKATYKGNDIDVFYCDDDFMESIRSKIIKAQTADVLLIAEGEQMVVDTKTYNITNHDFTDDGLETIISLSEV